MDLKAKILHRALITLLSLQMLFSLMLMPKLLLEDQATIELLLLKIKNYTENQHKFMVLLIESVMVLLWPQMLTGKTLTWTLTTWHLLRRARTVIMATIVKIENIMSFLLTSLTMDILKVTIDKLLTRRLLSVLTLIGNVKVDMLVPKTRKIPSTLGKLDSNNWLLKEISLTKLTTLILLLRPKMESMKITSDMTTLIKPRDVKLLTISEPLSLDKNPLRETTLTLMPNKKKPTSLLLTLIKILKLPLLDL